MNVCAAHQHQLKQEGVYTVVVSQGRVANQQDMPVFTQYGITMLQVQRFEFALKHLALLHAGIAERPTFEEAWQAIERHLSSTGGRLIEQLRRRQSVPERFLNELSNAKDDRNYLAHEYLFQYTRQRIVDSVKPADAASYLKEKAQYFHELERTLTTLARERRAELGIDHIQVD
jgi:hypothetical protein